jgi:hypothetical protein
VAQLLYIRAAGRGASEPRGGGLHRRGRQPRIRHCEHSNGARTAYRSRSRG